MPGMSRKRRISVGFRRRHRIELGRQYRQYEAARARLMTVLPTALVMNIAFFHVAQGRARQARIAYIGIPLR